MCGQAELGYLVDVEAARCQMRVAEVAERQQEPYDVAAACMEASKLYLKAGEQDKAATCIQRAKGLYIQSGKVTQAARACKELAMSFKDGDKPSQMLALQTFLEAAKLYDSDSQYTDMVRSDSV
jgi:hypothetical protein